MYLKIQKKTKKIKKGRIRIFGLFLLLIGIFLVSSFGYLYYQSRRVPDLREEYQITKLPPDVEKVLAGKTGPKINSETAVRAPIFMYHYIEYVTDKNDTIRRKLDITPDILTSQIETLKSAGYTFINPTDLNLAISGKRKLPQKIIMLTFDDGYMDFYTNVYPILKKEQVKGTVYVIPNFLDRPNFMFTFQLKEVAKSPFVEIGAHTMDHLWLKGIDKQKARYEIGQSRISLQKILNLPIDSFAYPYGAFDQQTIELVQGAGFTNAVSVVPGVMQTEENKYFLYRLRPGYRTGQVLLEYLSQNTFKPW